MVCRRDLLFFVSPFSSHFVCAAAGKPRGPQVSPHEPLFSSFLTLCVNSTSVFLFLTAPLYICTFSPHSRAIYHFVVRLGTSDEAPALHACRWARRWRDEERFVYLFIGLALRIDIWHLVVSRGSNLMHLWSGPAPVSLVFLFFILGSES